MWAHALQLAEELRGWKPMLPRAHVPINVEEQLTQPRQQQVDMQQQQAARESQVSTEQSLASASRGALDDSACISRKRKHVEDQQPDVHKAPVRFVRPCTTNANLHLHTCSPLSKAYETNSQTSLALQPATGPQMEKTVPLSELGLTGELLGAFQYGYTLKVSLRPSVASASVF